MSDKKEKGISENLKLLREINGSLSKIKNDILMLNNEIKCIKLLIKENNTIVKKDENISNGWLFGG